MRNLLILGMLFIAYKAYSAPKKKVVKEKALTEKTYTQKEFQEAVDKEVLDQVKHIKKASVVELTKEVIKERQELKKERAELLHEREQLKIAQDELAKKILEVNSKQKKILGCIEDNKRNEAKRVAQVVQIMSNMKPDKAAQVLSVQESDIAIKILSRIEPVKASKIFNKMDKEVSARLQKEYMSMKQ
jgi:flagellar motility protein MotE (MotC chaperone)